MSEFSRYDAGRLHFAISRSEGDIRRAGWDDLNLPARMAALAAAGLPVLQAGNSGSITAVQSLSRQLDTGIYFRDAGDLPRQLRDRAWNGRRQRMAPPRPIHFQRARGAFDGILPAGDRRSHYVSGLKVRRRV